MRPAPLATRREGVRRVQDGRARFSAARRVLDGIGGLGWSVIGFLLGAVFWHFVGFWSFVSDVVLAGNASAPIDRSRAEVVRIEPSQSAAKVTNGPLVIASCTVLQLDRKTGAISAGACGADFSASHGASVRQREDRAAKSDEGGAWVAPDTPARAFGSRRH